MQIYLVGGAVRDRLLQLPVYDRDWVVVGASPEEMLTQGYRQVGKDFPVFLHPQTNEEYALARTERKIAQGHKGFSVYSAPEVTLEEDLMRRDITINAIAEDQDGNLIDPYHGKQDLDQHVIRHISPAFSEDPLRVLRVARFTAKLAHLGFSIAPETLTLMSNITNSGELQLLSKERVWQETFRALGTPSPEIYLTSLLHIGALHTIAPALADALSSEERIALLPRLRNIESAEHRYVTLMFFASLRNGACEVKVCDKINASFAVPKGLDELSRLVSQCYEKSMQALAISSADNLDLLKKTDAFRRPERCIEVFICMRAAHQFTYKTDTQGLDFLISIIPKVCALKLAADIQKDLAGKEIGEELNRQRCNLIDDLREAYK